MNATSVSPQARTHPTHRGDPPVRGSQGISGLFPGFPQGSVKLPGQEDKRQTIVVTLKSKGVSKGVAR